MFFKKKAAGPIDFLIVGLGNPGRQYEQTRHNAGFMAIDSLADSLGVTIDRAQFHALTARTVIDGVTVLLMKPQTLMNLSGLAVQEAAMFYKLEPSQIVVLSDDINLAPGKLRIRPNGSAGGQNGLKDIIKCLGSEEFLRVRIGVGQKPHPEYDLAKWVLSRFSEEDMKTMKPAFENAGKAAALIAAGDLQKAMNLYSKK
ncbi:MAG: aminoacyl-tRNA hydrolase [Clostridia bacterium]|nr:aminoacyl-tRNA hydrolase [Clostridia bacterium]